MARIAGIDIPDGKRGEIALTYVYGIGKSSAKKILTKAGVDVNATSGEWTDDETQKIREIITEEYTVEGALRSEFQLSIKRLMDIVFSLIAVIGLIPFYLFSALAVKRSMTTSMVCFSCFLSFGASES